jgi:protein NrfC
MAGKTKTDKTGVSRRDFMTGGGAAIAGGALAGGAIGFPLPAEGAQKPGGYPLSTGYLVYDSRRCSGCQSCMLTCSLVHDGEAGASGARIQVARNVFDPYPQDIQIFVCRQCPEPFCVKNCPTGACHVSAENGQVRMIAADRCIGCKTCIESCPFVPHRTVFRVSAGKATKCDLCADTPYFSKKGGPAGTQACVEVCPSGALRLVHELPPQKDNAGYDRDLAAPAAKS